MPADMESGRLNIMVHLSSRLLCDALRGELEKFPESYQSTADHEGEVHHEITPDNMLVDAATLELVPPAARNAVKITLIDTGLDEDKIIQLMCSHRLDGVISTDTTTELFHKALQAIHAGQVWMDNSKLKALLNNAPQAMNSAGGDCFTKRERDIVLLVANGCKNREIASKLNMCEQTVKAHLRNIFKKASVTSRAQLVPLALKFKL